MLTRSFSFSHFIRHSLYVRMLQSQAGLLFHHRSSGLLYICQHTEELTGSPCGCCGCAGWRAAAQDRQTLSCTLASYLASSWCPWSYSKSLASLQRTHCSCWFWVCSDSGSVFESVSRISILSWCLVTSLSFSFTYTLEVNESSKDMFVWVKRDKRASIIHHSASGRTASADFSLSFICSVTRL